MTSNTYLDAKQYIGKSGTVWLNSLAVDVVVLDVKAAWGKWRFLVTPKAGHGSVWMESVIFND